MKRIGKIGSSIVHAFATLGGAMIFTWGVSTFGVKFFIVLGFEWMSASDVGLMIIGLGIMVFMALSDRKMSKIFDKYYDEWDDVSSSGGSRSGDDTSSFGGSRDEETEESITE